MLPVMPRLSRQERRRLQRLAAVAEGNIPASPEKRVRAIAELIRESERLFAGPVTLRDPDGGIVYADAGDGRSPATNLGMTGRASDLLLARQGRMAAEEDAQPDA